MLTFAQYHARNPQIYEEFKRFTFELISAGHRRLGSKQIIERIRWESMITTDGIYKVNNNYTVDYAYLFEHDYPGYAGVFAHRLRKSK
jgi:hypothetical protein